MNTYLKYGLIAAGALVVYEVVKSHGYVSGDTISPATVSTTTNNVTGISNGVIRPTVGSDIIPVRISAPRNRATR